MLGMRNLCTTFFSCICRKSKGVKQNGYCKYFCVHCIMGPALSYVTHSWILGWGLGEVEGGAGKVMSCSSEVPQRSLNWWRIMAKNQLQLSITILAIFPSTGKSGDQQSIMWLLSGLWKQFSVVLTRFRPVFYPSAFEPITLNWWEMIVTNHLQMCVDNC